MEILVNLISDKTKMAKRSNSGGEREKYVIKISNSKYQVSKAGPTSGKETKRVRCEGGRIPKGVTRRCS